MNQSDLIRMPSAPPAVILVKVTQCPGVSAAIGRTAQLLTETEFDGRRNVDLYFFEPTPMDVAETEPGTAHSNANGTRARPTWMGRGELVTPIWSGTTEPGMAQDILVWGRGAWRRNPVTRNMRYWWAAYSDTEIEVEVPTTSAELRTKLVDAFNRQRRRADWCGAAETPLRDLGVLQAGLRNVNVTMAFEIRASDPDNRLANQLREAIINLVGSYRFDGRMRGEIKVDLASPDLEFPFDRLGLAEATKQVHAKARDKIREYGGNTANHIREILRQTGIPFPPPAPVSYTITVTGTTEDDPTALSRRISDRVASTTELRSARVQITPNAPSS